MNLTKVTLCAGVMLLACLASYALGPVELSNYLPAKQKLASYGEFDWSTRPQEVTPRYYQIDTMVTNKFLSINVTTTLWRSSDMKPYLSERELFSSRQIVKIDGLPSKRTIKIVPGRSVYYYGFKQGGIGSDCVLFAKEGRCVIKVNIVKSPQNSITDRAVQRENLSPADLRAAEDVMLGTLDNLRAANLTSSGTISPQ